MTPYPLSKTDPSTKILITLFLVTMAVSISVAELNVNDKVGWTAHGVVQRYGPDEPQPDFPADAPPPLDADLPVDTGSSDPDAPPPLEPSGRDASLVDEPLVARLNTFTLLLDVTHPHVFELPLVIFVLAHFFMRTRVPNWVKIATYFVSFSGIAAFLGAPWLVRYISIQCAPTLLVGATLIGVTSVVMIIVPIWDMWTPPRKKTAPVPRHPAA